MDNSNLLVTINRLGIIFNFIAGFLVAPELIGLERIKKAQSWINSSWVYTKGVLGRLGPKKEIREKILMWILFFLVFFSNIGYLLYEYIWNKSVSALFFLIGFQVLMMIIALYQSFKRYKLDRKKYGVFLYIFFSFIPVALLFILFFLFYWTSLFIVNILAEIVFRRLTLGSQFKGLLISLGVFLYILGNLLQLIATF